MLMAVAVVLTGCFSRSPDLEGSAVSETPVLAKPSLSMSMARVPTDAGAAPTATSYSPVVMTPIVAAVPAPEVNVNQPLTSDSGVTFYRFKSGDPVVVHLRGIYPKDEAVEDIIDEDGNITIPLIGDIPAVGKSTSQLEADITKFYIEGGFYRAITVNVVMPSPFYFIRGEIRSPGRFPVVSGVTILQAIAAAGGYTEFANQRSVQLIRGKTTSTINMRDIEKNPERDIRLESGDVIVVSRSIL
jgi:polysaccharide export outer membrane protein